MTAHQMGSTGTVAPPRTGRSKRAHYLTLRVTGVMLAVLALGHYGLTHVVNDVAETDAAFVASRWSSVLWIVWDGLLLASALLHAAAGLATVVRDHRPDPGSRRRWLAITAGVIAVLFVLGITVLTVSVLDSSP